MKFLSKPIKAVLIFLVIAAAFVSRVSGQNPIVLFDTKFEGKPGKESLRIKKIEDITTLGPLNPIVSSQTFSLPTDTVYHFNKGPYYGFAQDPSTLDSTSYIKAPLLTGLFISAQGMSYNKSVDFTFKGIKPISKVSVTLRYKSIIDTTKNRNCLHYSIPVMVGAPGQTTTNQFNLPQILIEKDSIYTFTLTASQASDVTFNISVPSSFNGCAALGITRLTLKGLLEDSIISSGNSICLGDSAVFRLRNPVNARSEWQINNGSGWVLADSDAVFRYAPQIVGTTLVRHIMNIDKLTYTSNIIPLTIVKCCETGSAKLIYYDDFGTADLKTDTSGKTYKVWDFSDPDHPKQITKTTPYPFRWTTDPPLPGFQFSSISAKPVDDGQYAIASYMTALSPYLGITGSRLTWSNDITGYNIVPSIGLDHSMQPEGAALLINPVAPGSLFKKTLKKLCKGRYYVEAYITVFTYNKTGVDITLHLVNGKDTVSSREVANSNYPGDINAGEWVKIKSAIDLTEDSLVVEFYDNSTESNDGNDLVLDDLKIYSCNNCPVTALDQTAMSSEIFFYPNPSEDMVYFNDLLFYQVYNSLGMVVASGKGNKTSVGNLPKGIYRIQMKRENGFVKVQSLLID